MRLFRGRKTFTLKSAKLDDASLQPPTNARPRVSFREDELERTHHVPDYDRSASDASKLTREETIALKEYFEHEVKPTLHQSSQHTAHHHHLFTGSYQIKRFVREKLIELNGHHPSKAGATKSRYTWRRGGRPTATAMNRNGWRYGPSNANTAAMVENIRANSTTSRGMWQ